MHYRLPFAFTTLLLLISSYLQFVYTTTSIDPNDPNECRAVDAQSEQDSYRGNLSVAYDGTECQPWVRHPNYWRRYWSRERAIEESNYCRNPDNDKLGPWCVVNRAFKYCNVPRCAKDVGCYEDKGEQYAGHQDRTADGQPCTPWNPRFTTSSRSYRFRLYQNTTHSTILSPMDRRLQTFSACRNPGGTSSRPWCHTSARSGPRNETQQYCDIPRCDAPSTLGYPLLDSHSVCAQDFVEQVQVTTEAGKPDTTIRYCMAPERILHPGYRKQPHARFTEFCLFQLGESAYCPAGFNGTKRFHPILKNIKHVSGPSAWHPAGQNLVMLLLCCSDPNYFNENSPKPYILLEKISAYKLNKRGDPRLGSAPVSELNNHLASEVLAAPEADYTIPSPTNVPVFVSVQQCPSIENMTRLVLLATRLSAFNMEDYLPLLFADLMCEYYPVNPSMKKTPTNGPANAAKLALIVQHRSCPLGYEKVYEPREIYFLVSPTNSLCVPSTTVPEPKPVVSSNNGYCLLVAPEPVRIGEPEPPKDAWNHVSEFTCPAGFRPNEIHFHNSGNRLKLCCTGALTDQSSSNQTGMDAKLSVPFGAEPPFVVIQNGKECPTFYVGTDNLSFVKYSRPLLLTRSTKLTLIGPDDPLRTFEDSGVGMCQYLSQTTQLAVNSLNFDCNGLGHRSVVIYGGATCSFEVLEGHVFPPGKYCLTLISSTCPVGFHRRSGVVRIGINVRPLGNLCCRTEESIGAIRFPVKLEAPFKLPAVHRPCQAIENFNVDSELQYCVYYPQGKTPQTLLVWPRVVKRNSPGEAKTLNSNDSVPIPCAVTLRRERKPERSNVDRLMIYFNLIHDQWLTHKRPRWSTSVLGPKDVCFNDVHGSALPTTTLAGKGYCMFVFGSCPKRNFEMLGASPYLNSVLCCTVATSSDQNESSSETEHHAEPLRSLVTLGHASPKEVEELRGFSGTKVLDLDVNSTTCPQFSKVQLRRRVVEGLKASNGMVLENSPALIRMFNVTHMSTEEFRERTGIWAHGDIAYTVYCEYSVRQPRSSSRNNKTATVWPVGKYALPKPVTGCPNDSEVGISYHNQDEFGFHYSQPIHLDGIYLQGEKSIWLEYCIFNTEEGKHSPSETTSPEELPAGHYCVLRVGGECPNGFIEGTLSILEGPHKLHPRIRQQLQDGGMDSVPQHTTEFDIQRTRLPNKDAAVTISRLDYHFCCRTDSPGVDFPIQGFPTNTGAFYLYRMGDKCQQIEGMRVTEEYMCMDAPNSGDSSWTSLNRTESRVPYSVKGLTPTRIPFASYCDVEINLCYYEKDVPHPETVEINVHNAGQWPIGAYALPNAHRSDMKTACPPGFTQKHMSLVSLQAMFYEIEIIPAIMGSYFLEILGHNQSALNVHYCERDLMSPDDHPGNTTLPPPVSAEQLALQWPKGEYCVISTDMSNHCPPGLNRHSRSVAELCCRTDKVKDPVPVDWPFFGDFFLFGGDSCLPIKNTHVERYPVRLLAVNIPRTEPEWDILCHYIPIEWASTERKWPSGDYMLPIGRRSGLKTSMTYLTEYTDDITHKHVSSNPNQVPTSKGSDSRYKCPETFQRARFTFISKDSETRQVSKEDGKPGSTYNVVAMTSMEFCIRDNVSKDAVQDEWPRGDYCVFTMNSECPTGMEATRETPLKIPNFLLKSVDLVDEYGEKLENKHWHEEANNHVVYFMRCCREDHSLLLRLPSSSDGYYLARSTPLCSSVPGTLLDQEQVATFLTIPAYEKAHLGPANRELTLYRDFFSPREGMMYLCYYHPGTGLDYSVVIPPEMHHYATVNLTEKDLDDMARLCGCAQNAVCIPHRRVECFCKPGYFGDGRHTCRAVTPLTDGCANLCDPEAICVERLEPVIRNKKRVTRHSCVCGDGFVGDGFTCHPSCTDRECRPFSRCVHDVVNKKTRCECLEGTVDSLGRCNLDIYKSLQHEKDLPHFIVDHDHCLSEETQLALRELKPSRYFYVFAPDDLLRTCNNVTAHIVVRSEPLTEKELKSATAESPIILLTENNTVIEIYPQNDTWVIDGHLAQTPPMRFMNGEMYPLSAPLKLTPYVQNRSGFYVGMVIVSLLLVILLVVLVYKLSPHRRRLRMPLMLTRGRVPPRRTFWRQQGEGVLVEEADSDN